MGYSPVPHNWCKPWDGQPVRGCKCSNCSEIRRRTKFYQKTGAKGFPQRSKDESNAGRNNPA